MFLSDYTPQVVTLLSALTIVGQVIALGLLALVLQRSSRVEQSISNWIVRHSVLLMLIVALVATGGSLFFSEIAGWTPCKLCWLQRIFMYPQVILLAVALWRKERSIAWYILALSIIGIIFSIVNYGEQVQAHLNPLPLGGSLKPCDASGVSCAGTEIKFAFGYVTIPLMAATAFLMNGLTSLLVLMSGNKLETVKG